MMTRILRLAGYKGFARGAHKKGSAAAKPEPQEMTEAQLLGVISDPKGRDLVISGLSDEVLALLLDALYRNLDTPCPEPSAIFWYETGVEESLRRARGDFHDR
jgi:hypothetical protein